MIGVLGESTEVIRVAGDDDDVRTCGVLVGDRSDDRIDAGGMRTSVPTNGRLAQGSGVPTESFRDVGDRCHLEEPVHGHVVSRIAGEEALRQHGRRDDDILQVAPQDAEASA